MKLVKLAFFLSISCMLSGYGYMGELPELGKTTKEIEEPVPSLPKIQPDNPLAIIAPRVSTGYNINKYSNYIADIKEVDMLLKEIKAILEKEDNPKNRLQLFNAKSFLLSLYVQKFQEKYGDGPEKYYESYKQLISLDEYLKKVDHSNAYEAIEPINTVIGIISEAN